MFPGVFAKKSAKWQAKLHQQVQFPAHPIILHGPNVVEPRDVAFYGPAKIAPMQYAGLTHAPQQFTSIMIVIQRQLERFCQLQTSLIGPVYPLPALLINFYRNGKDSMGLHSDKEVALGSCPFLVSLSLGAKCQFIFKHKTLPTKHSLILQDGTVLIMTGAAIQQNWKHGIFKEPTLTESRWNLSFRNYLTKAQVQQKLKYNNNNNNKKKQIKQLQKAFTKFKC